MTTCRAQHLKPGMRINYYSLEYSVNGKRIPKTDTIYQVVVSVTSVMVQFVNGDTIDFFPKYLLELPEEIHEKEYAISPRVRPQAVGGVSID